MQEFDNEIHVPKQTTIYLKEQILGKCTFYMTNIFKLAQNQSHNHLTQHYKQMHATKKQ